jgi:hypothetical protein
VKKTSTSSQICEIEVPEKNKAQEKYFLCLALFLFVKAADHL